jgi:hypothetical protein
MEENQLLNCLCGPVVIYQSISERSMPDVCKLLMGKITFHIRNRSIIKRNHKYFGKDFSWGAKKVNRILKRLEEENILKIIDDHTLEIFNYHRYTSNFIYVDDCMEDAMRSCFDDLNEDFSIYENTPWPINLPRSIVVSKLSSAEKLLMGMFFLQIIEDKEKKTRGRKKPKNQLHISKQKIRRYLNWDLKKISNVITMLEEKKIIKSRGTNKYKMLNYNDILKGDINGKP